MQCEEKVLKLNWVENGVTNLVLASGRATEVPGLKVMPSVPHLTLALSSLGGDRGAQPISPHNEERPGDEA